MNPLALLLADSRFPSGSYAHSLGLEQAVNDGLTDVPAFIRARQRLVAEADARFAVEARRAACIQPVYRGLTPVYALHTCRTPGSDPGVRHGPKAMRA